MSQTDAILRDLRKGKRVTPLDALKAYGSMRLGARIWDLRKRGVPIVRDMVHDRKNNRRYAVYWLAGKGRAA